jgi:hypothetical protein
MIKHLTLSEQKGMITHPLHSTMKNPHSILLILAISSLVTVQPSFAESVDYSASVGVIIEDFHYEEENDAGDLLDSEDGLLPGLAFELKAGAGNWLVKGNYHLLRGEVDYQAYSGSDSELNSQTDTLINEVSLSLGYVQEIAENTCLEYFGGIGLRLWDRDPVTTWYFRSARKVSMALCPPCPEAQRPVHRKRSREFSPDGQKDL